MFTMNPCTKLMLIFGLCLFVNALKAEFVPGKGKLFQSDEGVTETIIRLVSEDPVSFRKSVAKYAAFANVEMSRLDPFIPTPSQNNCQQCAALVTLMKIFLPILPEELLKALVVEVCTNRMEEQGFNAEIICRPTVENYARHVIFIFGNLTKSGEEACDILNLCSSSFSKSHSRFGERRHEIKKSNLIEDTKKNIRLSSPSPRRTKKAIRKNTFTVAHITDIHVEPGYLNGSATTDCELHGCCTNETGVGTGSAHPYGDYRCNPPPLMVEHLLDFIATLNPDIVAYTGDSPRGGTWKETFQNQRGISKWVADAIAEHIPGVPAYAAFGNHECFPTNMFYAPDPDVQSLIQGFYNQWADLSSFGVEQEETITTAGYYAINATDHPNLKIVSINGNYGFDENWYNLLNDVEPGFLKMKEDIEQALVDAENANQKVLLLVHHPSGGNVLYYDEWVSNISIRFKDIILYAVRGHTHSDTFNIIMDPETSQPVASHFTEISMDSNGFRNPGLRLYHMDPVSLTLLDYDQYYLNMSTLADDIVPEVEFFYSASEMYNLADLTPASMYNLTLRFEEDDELFNTYWSHKSLRPEDAELCVDECKRNALCDIRSSTIEQQRACKNAPETTTAPTTTSTSAMTTITTTAPTTTSTSAMTTITTTAAATTAEEQNGTAAFIVPSLALNVLVSCFYFLLH